MGLPCLTARLGGAQRSRPTAIASRRRSEGPRPQASGVRTTAMARVSVGGLGARRGTSEPAAALAETFTTTRGDAPHPTRSIPRLPHKASAESPLPPQNGRCRKPINCLLLAGEWCLCGHSAHRLHVPTKPEVTGSNPVWRILGSPVGDGAFVVPGRSGACDSAPPSHTYPTELTPAAPKRWASKASAA